MGLVEGTREYLASVRFHGERFEGTRKFSYYGLCALAYPVTAIVGTGEFILSRLKSGGLERK